MKGSYHGLLLVVVVVALLTGSCGRSLPAQRDVPETSSSTNLEIRSVPGISDDLVRRIINDISINGNNFSLSTSDIEVLYANLKLELHDLNNDGASEYFLYIDHHDWCGAGANCDYWVYQRTGETHRLMLTDKVLRPQRTITNGYRDLWSESPMGFCGPNLARLAITRYTFDGARYQKQSEEWICRRISLQEKD